jgi:tRNA (guanine-N7-)-methyltransferase
VISRAAKPAIALDSFVERLDLQKIFGRIAPLHIDLGCGDGSFLCELAAKYPAKNFLGIDRQRRRITKTTRKAAALPNVRVLDVEIASAVRYLLPPDSVETFYLLFPDPWPKRRHHRRRIVTPEFLDSIQRALEPAGLLHIATDHFDYFQHIERLVRAGIQNATLELDRFKRSSSAGLATVDAGDLELPLTKFEKRFRAQGAPIYRLSLRKVSPVT